MDAREINKVLLALNVLISACAGFPGAQLLSARVGSYEYPQFNANSNFSQYNENNATVNRSATNTELLTDIRVVQHESANNKVGEYEGYDQSPLSVIQVVPEAEVEPSELAVEPRAAYVPRGGSEHAVEQTEQLLSSNRNSRIKRSGDYGQLNKDSDVVNYYKGDLSNTNTNKFSQENIRSKVTNYYGKTKSSCEWIPTTPEKARALIDRAVVGGHERDDLGSLWVIRAMYEGHLIPGKLAVNNHKAYVPWGGYEHTVEQIEVFCAPLSSVDWIKSSNGNVPPNAILGGHTYSGDPLYIARATEQTSLAPGMLNPDNKCLHISYGGVEICKTEYQVLCKV